MITGSQDDAGRLESGIAEKKDCTVRAYAIMKNIPYPIAHETFKLLGRKQKRGTNIHIRIYNAEFVNLKRPNMTVKTFIENYAIAGRWIIQIRGHVFAVVDKEIKDIHPMYNLNRHVKQAWMLKAK